MRTATGLAAIAIAAALTAGAGYWAGLRKAGGDHDAARGATPRSVEAGDPAQGRKPLYYRHPMGLPDTSPTPKKDAMGMDYIPVYAESPEAASGADRQIVISTEKVQKLGVRTESAELRRLDRTVRAAGRVEPDERRLYTITPKFEGYVERLYVDSTGQPVVRGQALFEAYSPELVSAQREYAIAAQGVRTLGDADNDTQKAMKQLADSSLARLKNWDVSADQVRALAASGEIRRTLVFHSPVDGVVIEKKALQGMRFMPGEMLYQVADLSAIWVIADVFEQDIGLVQRGAKARVTINAYPDRQFAGAVTYVYPTLQVETRTVRVRIELPNPAGLLKPGMYAEVTVPVAAKNAVVTVPASAIIDSGTRRIVLVQAAAGRFEPRDVTVGARSDSFVEILHGVKSGENVVVAANFLIDAESNLRAAVSGFSAGDRGKPPEVAAGSPPAPRTADGSHRATGTVDSLDAKAGTVMFSHGPIASLNWPAMSMEFKADNAAILKALRAGSPATVDIIERQPGSWVITRVHPAPPGTAPGRPAASGGSHAGH